MPAAVRESVSEALRALAAVFRNAPLRRLHVAHAVVVVSVQIATVVWVVVAYRAGGVQAVAALALVRTVVLTLVAPFGAVVADRYPRHLVMAAADGARALVLVGGALVADGPVVLIVAVAGVAGVVGTASAPARSALLPVLARTPEELTAANVVAGTSMNLAVFVGPAAAGAVLALVDPVAGFGLAAAGSAASAAIVAGVRAPARGGEAPSGRAGRTRTGATLAGFRFMVSDRTTALVVTLYSAQTLAGGAIAVLLVAAADELLALGESGVGFLYAALGVGGLLGGVVGMLLGGRGLGPGLALGAALGALPVALVGAWPYAPLALALFALSGGADAVGDLSGLTLLQRRVPNELFARAIGAMSTTMLIASSAGNLLAPVLVALVGTRAALIGIGLVVPAVVVVLWRPLTRLDVAAPPALPILGAVPLLTALPRRALEQLAALAERERVPAGAEVVRQGEPGDRFYVVLAGEVEFLVDGRVVGRGERGEHFGEIALLRDEPRTATVRAASDAELYSLPREEFVAAVRAETAARQLGDELVASRLRRAAPA